ncbi:TetR/AcrR family transcriptional regulator [Pseudonocardia sp. GCM10023141]|uniref:TetR/AcrR family transcriptional regulator n=1 Tax=Pseudonocardia sp. GCM10023141 TaxID=3252653 RepID=UPI00360DC8E5
MPVAEQNVGRMERVLDAAAELLVRWGYQRVTIEDVARHASVGKGTVYLHFPNKEALFLTVLLRQHHTVIGDLAGRMLADPAEAMPSQMFRSVYLQLSADPIARPLYLGDSQVLGRLASEAAGLLGELGERRDVLATRHLELLRAAGRVRTDLGIDELLHLETAIGAGFFFIDSTPGPLSTAARADLLAHAVASAVELPGEPPVAVAAEIAGDYRSLAESIQDEWRRLAR